MMTNNKTNTFANFFDTYRDEKDAIMAEVIEKLNRTREQCEGLERTAIQKIASLLIDAEAPISAEEISAFVPELCADSIRSMLEYAARAYEYNYYENQSAFAFKRRPTSKCWKYRDILPAIRKIKTPGGYVIACDEKGNPIPGAEPKSTYMIIKFEAIKGEWL